MQKIRTIFTSLLVFISIFSFIFPVFAGLRLVDKYDYSDYTDKINISSEGDSLAIKKEFQSERTTFFLEFDGYTPMSPDDIEVEWSVDGRNFHRHLDWDNESGYGNTTFPLVTAPRKQIEFTLTFRGKDRPNEVRLITSNQSSRGKTLRIDANPETVNAIEGVKIIKRSEWGADESLRYVPNWKREQKKQEWLDRGRTPRVIEETEQEKEKRLEGDRQYNALIASDDDANTVVRLSRYSGENKLIFPIRTAKKLNRIFLHHTAEGLDQDADDASLIRAIYLYHSKSKGWGDIGYNFLIGQRGVIYEGRAGGDYVEGAHAFANNLGTVGISVIGNYQSLHLNRDQRAGLIEAIAYVAKKYGINVDEQASGLLPCSQSESCIWKSVSMYRLSGHKDVSNTTCPGENIYKILPELRSEIVGKVGKIQPVLNRESSKKDSLDPEDEIMFAIKGTSKNASPNSSSISSYVSNKENIDPPQKSISAKTIKIRLSYPSDTLSFRSATNTKAVVRLNARILPFNKNMEGNVFLSGSNEVVVVIGNKKHIGKTLTVTSDVVRLPSWNRIPLWDSSKRYNDNLFRGKIYVSNQSGKLLVVNELSIEDYLKGLGEVSDNDHTEKIKTILLAARSYAYFYIRGENRKYSTKLYDGSDNPDEFQRYLGYGYELRSPNVSSLVESTVGQVITFNEKLIKTWYFSSSDGMTRSYKEFCESNAPGKKCEDIPYLQATEDPAGVGKVRNGHGVGISGIGATFAANNGKNYKQIIAYYLKGTLIRNITTLKN